MATRPMPQLFDALSAARELLGWKLVHETNKGRLAGYIVETEAYWEDDPASHTFRGQTPRNTVMFGPAGHAYVYISYGLHYCLNVVCGEQGSGQAVLIRALEPVEGIAIMRGLRGVERKELLASGPGRLTQALGISMEQNDYSLESSTLRLQPGFQPQRMTTTTRIGISKAREVSARFYVTGNPFISRL